MSNNRNDFRPIVGIDLGTTNSAAGYIHKGKPELIQHADGQTIIPSVVLIDPSEKVVVGEDARSALIAMPDRTKAAVKREMGSAEPANLAGKPYVPEEVSALILKEIKVAVDDELGEGEKEAVITVPAYFTNEQRQATKKAGELAGFTVERIINEPTAAALAFGLQHLDENRQLLVYDLGGGTFDVSVVEMMDGIMEVKASSGNSKLGGDDFDWLLVDALAEIMIDENGVDPREDVRGLALLKDEAESVKKQLSTEESAEISLPVVVMKDEQPIGLYTTITRETFIQLISSLLQETMDKISEVLNEADLPAQAIDDILLVGGSTRIPQVHDLISDFFGKKPRQDVHPDEAIARGAAVQAGLKSGALSDSGLIVTDVAPFSMGIAVLKSVTPQKVRPGAYKAIIDKNTTIPVTRTERFGTSVPNQTEVMVEVYQGEEEWVKDNHFLNEFTLEGLPEGPAGSEAVDVTFRYNLNGILEVTAKSVSNGKEMTITLEDAIDRSSEEAYEDSIEEIKQSSNERYDDESLDFAQQDMFDFMEEDMSDDELLQEAKRTKEHCRETLDNVSADERKQLKKVMETLTQAINSQDADDLQEAIDDATDVFIDLEM